MNDQNPENLIRSLIEYVGEDPSREGLVDTPKRVVKSFEKLYAGYRQKPEDVLTVFSDESYDEMIVVKDIEFYSMCEHHMLPFTGRVHVAYIPNGKIIGLSKMPRLVEMYARRLQNQERLTYQVAHALYKILKPKGAAVVVEAKHLCMMARGVQKQQSEVVTSSMLGLFKSDFNTRNEFLRHVGRH